MAALRQGWEPPAAIAHLVSDRLAANGEAFTFLSGHGNYDFMVKANYKICASAMPQLKCACEDAAGGGCKAREAQHASHTRAVLSNSLLAMEAPNGRWGAAVPSFNRHLPSNYSILEHGSFNQNAQSRLCAQVAVKQGPGGFLIQSSDYKSGDWALGLDGVGAGPRPNNP